MDGAMGVQMPPQRGFVPRGVGRFRCPRKRKASLGNRTGTKEALGCERKESRDHLDLEDLGKQARGGWISRSDTESVFTGKEKGGGSSKIGYKISKKNRRFSRPELSKKKGNDPNPY